MKNENTGASRTSWIWRTSRAHVSGRASHAAVLGLGISLIACTVTDGVRSTGSDGAGSSVTTAQPADSSTAAGTTMHWDPGPPECTNNLVLDGGFELGTPSPVWSEASLTFGSPLCDSSCTEDAGASPHTGAWWAWFGGVGGESPPTTEAASLEQLVTIDAEYPFLRFYFQIRTGASTGDDTFTVELDGATIFAVTDLDISDYATYTEVILDVGAWADAAEHTLRFSSEHPGTGLTSFFLDDVSLYSCSEPSDDGTTSGSSFIDEGDIGKGPFECDLFAQNCPPGEKCMPWAGDGGGAWNAVRCSPVADDPGQPGEECTVEGSGTSGVDSCDVGAMCWDVDPETNVGVCQSMCIGNESNPVCEDPDTFCTVANDGVIFLCLPTCNPILQDCPDMVDACYPIGGLFTCAPDVSGEMGAYGDPCQYINVCDPGLFCVDPAMVPGCAGAEGCCSEVCDIEDEGFVCMGEAGGQQCQAWFAEGEAPPGFENIGICAIPA